jgi:hypothetical protein
VLCELSGSGATDSLDALMEESLAAAFTDGAILDATVAASGRERDMLWKIRGSIPRHSAARAPA